MPEWVAVAASVAVAVGTGLLALVTWQMARNGKRQMDWLVSQDLEARSPRLYLDGIELTLHISGGRRGTLLLTVGQLVNLGPSAVVFENAVLRGRGGDELLDVPAFLRVPSVDTPEDELSRLFGLTLSTVSIDVEEAQKVIAHTDAIQLFLQSGSDSQRLWRISVPVASTEMDSLYFYTRHARPEPVDFSSVRPPPP